MAHGRSPQPLSVLVIEDEPPIRQLVVTYLEAEGFSVVGVGDGESGLEHARELSPDVIVLDLMRQGRSRQQGGSGIGLAMARAVVQAHSGPIRAQSPRPGKGQYLHRHPSPSRLTHHNSVADVGVVVVPGFAYRDEYGAAS